MSSIHSINKDVEGKFCIGFNREKHWCPLDEFVGDRTRKDKLSNKCNSCYKEYTKTKGKSSKRMADKKYQQSDKGKIRNYKAGNKQREEARRIRNELQSNGCAICGYDKCVDALVFHHTNPEDKLFNLDVTYMMVRDKRLVEEINKCIILCCNCHREIHYNERIRFNK